MASGRKGQSEINLGAGHVVGMFLAVVVLCGIFFTLGYVIGRGGPSHKTADLSGGPSTAGASGNSANADGVPASTGWDFFPKKSSSSNGSSAPPGLTPQPPPQPQPAGPISMSPKTAGLTIGHRPPLLPGGRQGLLLQVAAMTNRGDALALAGFLKQKGYPAIVWGPSSDRLYRVQVGPYPDAKTARAASANLEKEGFKSILKK